MTKITYIPGEIANAAIDEHGNRKPVTRTHHIFDDAKDKNQAEVNAEVDDTFAFHQSEINALNSQNYVTVNSFSSLPATGAVDTVYRVSNWDGTHQDPSVYSEYAWNGSQYVHLSNKTQIGEVFDISAYHATGGELAKYADLAAALGTNGANIPDALRKGGMSVKFVLSSDNKYVQYRLMSDIFSTTEADWQGVDDEPIVGSDNLVKSGGVLTASIQYYIPIKELIDLGKGNISSNDYFPAFNKIKADCEYLYIQTYGTSNARVVLKIWNDNGELLKSYTLGDLISEGGIYHKTIKLPSGAHAYLATYEGNSYSGDAKNMFIVQYIKEDNIDIIPLKKAYTSNLLDTSKTVDGVINADGSISASSTYITSGFIRVEPSTTYNIKNNVWGDVSARRIVQYNQDGVVIAGGAIDNVSSITTSNKCYYIRLSIAKTLYDSIANIGVFKNNIAEFSYYGYSLDIEEDIKYISKGTKSIITKEDLEAELLNQRAWVDIKLLPYKFLGDSFEKLVSENLLDAECFHADTLVDVNNNMTSSDLYSSYYDLPITEGSYILKNSDWEDVPVRIWSVRKANGTRLEYGQNVSTLNLPNNSAKISLAFSKVYLTKPIGLFPSTAQSFSGNFDEYVGIKLDAQYKELPGSAIIKKEHVEEVKREIYEGIEVVEEEVQEIRDSLTSEDVTLLVNGNEVTFNSGTNVLKCNKSYGNNSVFNFTQRTVGGVISNMGDDVAPIHIAIHGNANVTTIGANHGWNYAVQANIQSHGKSNSDIGTLWTDSDNNVYVLAEIVDTNNILFLPQNKGDRIDIDLYSKDMAVGTISNNNETMTVVSVSNPQLHDSVTTHTLHIYDANGKEVANDGTYKSKFFDVVESYEIKNLADIISNLIARQSQSPIPTDAPEFVGDGIMKITNVYRVFDNTSVLVSATVQPLQKIYINNGDIMFSQSQYLVSGPVFPLGIQYYAPGSKPTSSYDLTKPTSVDWSASGNPSFYANIQSQQDENVPINRIIQYYPNKYGFALGFLNYVGVGKNLLSNTNNSFEIRGYSGKVYPHGVEGAKIGSVINVGDCFSAVMYRANIDITTKTTERLSYYSIDAPDGYTYLFADYAAAVLDKINLGIKYNGKAVELVESNNCSLMSDVYNDGVLINASYTNNQTSYIILKIKS